MTLTTGHWVLLIAIVGLPLGLVALYLRAATAAIRADVSGFRASIEERLSGHKERLNGHEQRLQQVEQKKVGHHDWVRVVVSQQRSLEVTRELVKEIGGKLDATLGISGSMMRIAKALEEKEDKGWTTAKHERR
jgi:formate-dependent phosphoribosylglycinamide formyltransferase (GAR transformylase)